MGVDTKLLDALDRVVTRLDRLVELAEAEAAASRAVEQLVLGRDMGASPVPVAIDWYRDGQHDYWIRQPGQSDRPATPAEVATIRQSLATRGRT